MRKKILVLKLLLVNVVLLSTLSCSKDDMLCDIDDSNVSVADTTMKSCNLVFNLSVDEFDTPTRSSSETWAEGDKVYLTFDNAAYGIAEYNSGSWNINYYGTLTNGISTTCIARYFDNPNFASASVVKLNATTGVYEDLNAVYVFDGNTLSITSTLSPKTGRIRFKGDKGSSFVLFGITHISSFGVATGTLSDTPAAISLTVADDGYTPYVYGYFTDTKAPRINILSSTNGFNRSCNSSIFKTGESGYMDIPTDESHTGWMNSLSFKIKDIEFTMIPVNKGTTLFCLGETEVTQGLYAAVMESTTTSKNYPKKLSNYSDCVTFISKLNALTSFDFRLPTKEEWQYAAKGGAQSQGYTYSGSNLISEVAWYEMNSDSKAHEVAQLMPNELGFYDMSGNLCEWTSTNSHGNSYYYCGGSYIANETYCTNTYSDYNSSHSYCGLRLALSIN